MTRPSPPPPTPPLLWDGHTLHGTPAGRSAEVWVPARFLACRRETLPNAPLPALKAAARLRADRLFSPLGPVAVDALLHPPIGNACEALLMALPKPALDAILKAAQAKNIAVRAVRVAELMRPIPPGGLVSIALGDGQASLMEMKNGQVVGICALGDAAGAAFAAQLKRERLRLGMAEDTPGGPPPAVQPDFLHPSLLDAEPLLARSGVRLGLLAAAALLAAGLGLSLWGWQTVRERNATRGQLAKLAPEAKILAAYRADIKTLAPWFEDRPDLAPCLHALAGALPALGAPDKVRLVRVRQNAGEITVVEGAAGDRAQMLAFLGRLRQDPRVDGAEIRSFRSPSMESTEVVFELGLRVHERTLGASSGKPRTGAEKSPELAPPVHEQSPSAGSAGSSPELALGARQEKRQP